MSHSEHILELIGEEEACPYLPGELARMQYKVIDGCNEATYQDLLEHGWRRFGKVFFRPLCAACQACKSLRVDVHAVEPDRSARRSWRRNRDLKVLLGRPAVSRDRLDLFDRYHRSQHERRGWEPRQTSETSYQRGFVEGFERFGREMTFWSGDRLVAVSLLDLLPNAISAVYCYYAPEERRRGLGVNSILHHIALARNRGIDHVYLGFWVARNDSLAYKARYKPHQLLVGRPDERSAAIWRDPATTVY